MWDKQPKLRFTQSELKILHNIIYFLPFCLMKDYNTLITSLRLALPTVRRAKPPLGTVRVLIINLPRKGLTPRACMGDIGSGSWAPELTTFMLHVISASPFWTIFIATFSIVLYNIVIPVINSITSINLPWYGQPKYSSKRALNTRCYQLRSSLWTSRFFVFNIDFSSLDLFA